MSGKIYIVQAGLSKAQATLDELELSAPRNLCSKWIASSMTN